MSVHYCYIVEAGPFVKIGYTGNLDSRLEALQTACPYEVSVLCLFPHMSEVTAREMELHFHKKFEHFRVRGEWFVKRRVLARMRKERRKW